MDDGLAAGAVARIGRDADRGRDADAPALRLEGLAPHGRRHKEALTRQVTGIRESLPASAAGTAGLAAAKLAAAR